MLDLRLHINGSRVLRLVRGLEIFFKVFRELLKSGLGLFGRDGVPQSFLHGQIVLLCFDLVGLLCLLPRTLSGVRIAFETVPALRRDGSAFFHPGCHRGIQQTDGHRGVDGNVFRAGRGGIRCRGSVVFSPGQRVGASHAGGLHIPFAAGSDLYGIRDDHAVFAENGLGAHVTVYERERCADAHGLALVVGGPARRSSRRAGHTAKRREGRGIYEIHLHGQRLVRLADIPRDEQCETAVLLADADRACQLFPLFVFIDHRDGGRQGVQFVRDQLSVHPVDIRHFGLTARDSFHSKAVLFSARRMLQEVLLFS